MRQVSVVYSRPGAGDQDWHTDGAHADAPRAGGPGAPYAVCVFVPLIDLDEGTGCTQFWPGTHADRELAGFGPASEVLGAAVAPYVAAGSAVLYDYRLMHRGLANRSRERPVLQARHPPRGPPRPCTRARWRVRAARRCASSFSTISRATRRRKTTAPPPSSRMSSRRRLPGCPTAVSRPRVPPPPRSTLARCSFAHDRHRLRAATRQLRAAVAARQLPCVRVRARRGG